MEKEVKLFDKRFVYFMWDDSLEGKEGFFADDICVLTDNVLRDRAEPSRVKKNLRGMYPFTDTDSDSDWRFFYYDPNYEVKRAFYEEGKQIQVAYKGANNWVDCDEPEWVDGCQFRIKPGCPCDEGIDSKACAGCPQDEARIVNEAWNNAIGEEKESFSPSLIERVKKLKNQEKTMQKKERPFKDCDELVEFWTKKYQTVMRSANTKPLIWVRLKCDGRERLIVAFGKGFGTDFVEIGNKAKTVPLQKLFDDYEFLDGSPVGMEVEK